LKDSDEENAINNINYVENNSNEKSTSKICDKSKKNKIEREVEEKVEKQEEVIEILDDSNVEMNVIVKEPCMNKRYYKVTYNS
jgi:hypothetical protein